jgi:hypothetical protein
MKRSRSIWPYSTDFAPTTDAETYGGAHSSADPAWYDFDSYPGVYLTPSGDHRQVYWDNLINACSSSNWVTRLIRQKFDFYSRALEATYRDIEYTEYALLYDRSSSVVQRQLDKADALRSIVGYLTEMPFAPTKSVFSETLALAERRLTDFSDVFSLEHEVAHLLFPIIGWDSEVLPEIKRTVLIRRDILSRGLVLRRFFRRITRDIRRQFRLLVRTLYMHMNDQSEEDESLVPVPVFQPIIHFHSNLIHHGQTRNFSPH